MEFERSADGTLTPLPAPSIDTGMGLERITAVLQGKDSNYDTDLFMPLLARVGELAGVTLRRRSPRRDISMRVVADHARVDDVPDRRRRHPVERMARLRAAQDHAARDAPRQAPRPDRAVPPPAGRGARRARWATPIPSCARNREMIEKTILAEENRFDAVLTDGLPRLEAEIAKALETPDRVLPGDAAFRLYDTFGVPYDFIEDTAATQRRARRSRRASSAAMEAQRGKARAQSAFGGGKKGEEFAVADEDRCSRTPAISSRATRPRASPACRSWRCSTTRASRSTRCRTGADGLRRARAHAVLPRSGRPGVRLRPHRQRSDRRDRRSSKGSSRIRPGLPRAHRVRVDAGTLHVRDIVTAEVDAERARRDAPQPHGHAPAPRGAAPGARHARQAGRLARRARSPALRLRALPAGHARRARSHRAHRQRADRPEHAGRRPKCDRPRRRSRRRDGAVRREVRRPGARRQRARLQHGAVRRHARVARPATSGFFVDRRRERRRGRRAPHRGADRHWARSHGRRSSARRCGASSTRCTSTTDQAVEAIERLQSDAKRLAREVTQLKTKLAMGGGGGADGGDDVVEVAGVKLARRKVGRPRQGRAARPRRFAEGADQERRRRPRLRRATARCRSSSPSRRI